MLRLCQLITKAKRLFSLVQAVEADDLLCVHDALRTVQLANCDARGARGGAQRQHWQGHGLHLCLGHRMGKCLDHASA